MNSAFLTAENSREIAEFFKENFDDGWTETMLRSGFDSGRFYAIGGYEKGELVGVITLSLSVDTADVEDVVTKKESRRSGVGTFLMGEALSFVKNLGRERVLLEVRQSNLPAVNLYGKFGFKEISVRKNYYKDGENALVMVKEI